MICIAKIICHRRWTNGYDYWRNDFHGGEKTKILVKKCVLVPIRSPQIPCVLAWDWTQGPVTDRLSHGDSLCFLEGKKWNLNFFVINLSIHKFIARHLKVKVALEQTMKAQRESRGIALLFV